MPQSYSIVVLPAAHADLAALSPELQRRIGPRIRALAQDVRPAGSRRLQGKRPYLRLRIGDYRVIYQIDDTSQTVTIVLVGHRRNIYQRLQRL